MKKINFLRENLENQFDSMPKLKMDNKKREAFLNAMDFVFKEWMPAQRLLDNTLAGENAYSSLMTNKGKTINYGHCILDELVELLNSIPWKHWKSIDEKTDYDNLKTELTDLMHFIPAMLNVLDTKGVLYNIDSIADEIRENKGNEFLDGLANLSGYSLTYNYNDLLEALNDKWESDNIADEIAFTTDVGICTKSKFAKEYKMIKRLIRVLTLTSYHVQLWTNTQEQIEADDYTTEENELIEISTEFTINQLLIYCIVLILDTYSKLFTFDLSIDRAVNDLWESYLVKSKLNLFRANNGYKEGTYIKMWNIYEATGETQSWTYIGTAEDNVIANKIAANLKATSKDGIINGDELYNGLHSYYYNFIAPIAVHTVIEENNCNLAIQSAKDLGHK